MDLSERDAGTELSVDGEQEPRSRLACGNPDGWAVTWSDFVVSRNLLPDVQECKSVDEMTPTVTITIP
jgi:hypothetical protein